LRHFAKHFGITHPLRLIGSLFGQKGDVDSPTQNIAELGDRDRLPLVSEDNCATFCEAFSDHPLTSADRFPALPGLGEAESLSQNVAELGRGSTGQRGGSWSLRREATADSIARFCRRWFFKAAINRLVRMSVSWSWKRSASASTTRSLGGSWLAEPLWGSPLLDGTLAAGAANGRGWPRARVVGREIAEISPASHFRSAWRSAILRASPFAPSEDRPCPLPPTAT
jgi:hypothetical protein